MSSYRLSGAWRSDLRVSLVGPGRDAGAPATVALEGPVESSVLGVAERVALDWPPAPLIAAENILIEPPKDLGAASVRVAVDGDRLVRVANLDRDALIDGFAVHLSERRDGAPRLLTVEAFAEADAVGSPIARRSLRIESAATPPVEVGPLWSPAVETSAKLRPAPVAPSGAVGRALETALTAGLAVARRAAARPALGGGQARTLATLPKLVAPNDARVAAERLAFSVELIDPETDFGLGPLQPDGLLDARFNGRTVDLRAVVSGEAAALVAAVRLVEETAAGRDGRSEKLRALASARERSALSTGWVFGARPTKMTFAALDSDGKALGAWRYEVAARRRDAGSRGGRRVFVGAGLRQREAPGASPDAGSKTEA